LNETKIQFEENYIWFVMCGLAGFGEIRGLTCHFWAENGKRK
jgi:hypothetical protein